MIKLEWFLKFILISITIGLNGMGIFTIIESHWETIQISTMFLGFIGCMFLIALDVGVIFAIRERWGV